MRLSEHPAFAHVDIEFMNQIQKTLDSSSSKNTLDIIQKLMQVSQEIKRRNIEFTPEMQNVLLGYFKTKLPKNQRSAFDAVFSLVQQQSNQSQH